MDIHLTFEHTRKYTSRGELIDVFYESERLCRSIDPEHDACRALEARGISGRAHFWREGKKTWDVRMGTKWGARHRTVEGQHVGPVVGKWEPFPANRLRSKAKEAAEPHR